MRCAVILVWACSLWWCYLLWGTTFVFGEQELETTTESDGSTVGQLSKDAQLWTLVNNLQEKVDKLQKQEDNQRSFMKELERKIIENQDDILISMADTIQMKQTVAEMQIRITRMEESLDEQKLEQIRFNFEQTQLKNDLIPYKKLKDNTRRSIRKMDKNLKKLSAKAGILSSQYQNLSESFFNFKHQHENEAKSTSEKLQNIELYINQSDKHMSPSDLFSKLKLRITKLSKNTQNLSNIIARTSESGSGEIETDYILSHKEESQNIIETDNSEGSGEIPIHTTPHRHKNYVLVSEFLHVVNERNEEISNLYDIYYILYKQMARLEDRLTSIQLGNFMEQLQNSLMNFTQNVITLEQWKTTSSGIINSTQFNHRQITTLTNMILNNTNYLRDLEWKLTNVQSLGYQQFHLLRMHVIRLNNTVQDMKEEMNQWHKNGRGIPHQSSSQTHPVTTATNIETIVSRVEDLGLQIIYNENRIAKLEIQVLNESLLQCKKLNSDIYQDSKILQLQKEIDKLTDSGILAKTMIRNLERAFYQLHGTNMNQSQVITTLIQDTQTLGKFLPLIVDIQQEITNYKFQLPEDCDEYYDRGYRDDGVYVIYPLNATRSVRVFCDMETGVGGWTVIQRRTNGELDFSKLWKDYSNGFGSIDNDHWLGNRLIHLLTANTNMTLKIEMVDIKDNFWVGEYKNFMISGEDDKYTLHIDGFHGNCTDSLSYSNGMKFSTQDEDNDSSSSHCAIYYTSGWWFKHCHHSNLNGRHNLGMVWYNNEWKDWIQLKQSVMKIRPQSS